MPSPDATVRLLAWCQEEIARLEQDLRDFETGRKSPVAGEVDMIRQLIGDLRSVLASHA